MKKKKEKRKNKLSALLLLLFLTIVLLATSTYAWFTTNRNVTISNIDVTVTTGGGIQISTDATTWKTIVSNADITENAYTGNLNTLPAIINPASTAGLVSGGMLSMFGGTVEANANGDFALTTAQRTDSAENTAYKAAPTGYTGYYVVFDVFLKADRASALYLKVGSGAKAGNTNTNIQNATRIGIINEGNADANADVSTITALNGGSTVTIYEPYYQSHTSYGITQAGLYYGSYKYGTSSTVAAGISGSTLTAGDNNDMIVTDGVKAAVNALVLPNTNASQTSSSFSPVNGNIGLTADFCTGTRGTDLLMDKVFSGGTIPAGVTKLKIYLWVEGQDVDCENNASGGTLSFNLAFSLDQSTVGS